MKRVLLLATVIAIHFNLQAQRAEKLNINNIRASITSSGGLFQDSLDFGKFTIKDTQYKTAIYAASLWVSAYSGESSYTSIQDFYVPGSRMNDETDYRFGPVATDLSQNTFSQKYDHVWKLSKQEIDLHKSNYNDANYNMPADISTWPAHGDTNNGEAGYLAPFQDLNGNQIYEPALGDYPLIRGDQCLFVIFNEGDRQNPKSDSSEAGLEFHLMVYAFGSSIEPGLRNGLFFHYQIYNRSNRNYDSLKVAYWNDVDLGDPTDDIIGSDSSLAMSYAYNGDSFDEGTYGFGYYPPAVGARFLSQNATGSQYYASFGAPPALSQPVFKAEYEWLLNHKWADASPIRLENPSGKGSNLNGDGWDTASSQNAPITKWTYNDQANWYFPPLRSGDNRQLLHHPSFSLNAGESQCIDLLISYARDSSSQDPYSSVLKLKTEQNAMAQHFHGLNLACNRYQFGTESFLNPSIQPSLFPNPVKDFLHIKDLDAQKKYHLKIADYSGRVIYQSTLNSSANQLDLSKFKPGSYILILSNDSHTFKPFKIHKL
tara:strand:+ start:492 stop:2120 length:1629 start_codon:yes stop_codon:yes gene_type:complete